MKILVHLVSGQNLPNYIASKIIGADKELFLFTKASLTSLKILEEILPNRLNPVEIPAWDYTSISNSIIQILDQYKDHELILNFTCGNKIMSQAAFSMFSVNRRDCVYINTEKNESIFFDNKNGSINVSPISFSSKVIDIIKLHGQIIKFGDQNFPQNYLLLYNWLKENFDDVGSNILRIAKQYSNQKQYKKEITEGKLRGSIFTSNSKDQSVKICYGGKEIQIQDRGERLSHFIFGGWFEYFCLEKIKALNYFDEAIIDGQLKTQNNPQVKNQLDLVAIKGIYPFIFECKSGGLKSDSIDKLTAIKQSYIGRYTSLFILTYSQIDNKNPNQKVLLDKMKDHDIIHLTFKQINKDIFTSFLKKENLK